MGYQHFGLAVSVPLTPAQFAAEVTRLAGGRRRVRADGSQPESDDDVVVSVFAVPDPGWPNMVEC